MATHDYNSKQRKLFENYGIDGPNLAEDRVINDFRVARALYLAPGGEHDLSLSLKLVLGHRLTELAMFLSDQVKDLRTSNISLNPATYSFSIYLEDRIKYGGVIMEWCSEAVTSALNMSED